MKREADREYVKEQPYRTTTVANLTTPAGQAVQEVQVKRPAPGTPPDSLYALPTAPSASSPYAYAVADANYPRPLTVHRPFFDPIPVQSVAEGRLLQLTVKANNIGSTDPITYSAGALPTGATFDAASRTLTWRPAIGQAGSYSVQVIANDGVLPVTRNVTISVTPGPGSGPLRAGSGSA
jgi:hypothetical protein